MDNFIQITIFCPPEPRVGAFVYRNAGKVYREVKHHVNVKRQTRIFALWPSFPLTCRLLFIISTHNLVVSYNFLSIGNVLSCFYLLIFCCWEILYLNLTFAVYTWSLNSLMNGKSRINVKVETRSTFAFTRGLSYIATILFTRAKFTCVGT